jgi:hypothetical protein
LSFSLKIISTVGTRGKGSNGHFSEFRPAVIGRGLGTRQPEVVSHIFYQSFWAINRHLQSDFIGFWPLLCGNVYGFLFNMWEFDILSN